MKRQLDEDIPKHESQARDESLIESLLQKAEKNRERNREHAKKTRLRKKEMLESMKTRLLELQRENNRLAQMVEESATANILLTLGASTAVDPLKKLESLDNSANRSVFKGNIIDQIRQKVRSESSSKSGADGAMADNGAGNDLDDLDSSSIDSSHEPSETNNGDSKKDALTLKRERNRVHAKLTRDRKRMFVTKMQQACRDLETQNNIYRGQLNLLLQTNTHTQQPPAIGQPLMVPLFPFLDIAAMSSVPSLQPFLAFPALAALWKAGELQANHSHSLDSTDN